MLEAAIIGAGPYGLSLAAHFRQRGISFRIFGKPMDSWVAHMPKGMLLKSDGFASNISDPNADFTLKKFCAERGISYADAGLPVRLDTFSSYGLAFRDRMVRELEEKLVAGVERIGDGFRVQLEDGETFTARRVVLAVGITHFDHMPPELLGLPANFASHSSCHRDLERFRGRSVVVLGAGSSAIDLAGLLHEAGVDVQLVARHNELKFHERLEDGRRPLWKRIRHPKSGLGPGLKSRLFANWPMVFRYFPEKLRLKIVRTHLGPAGGWFSKEKVVGRVPLQLGCALKGAEVRDGRVHLSLRAQDGATRQISADHVIAATGFKVNVDRLKFLSGEIRSKVKQVENTPVLSSKFESSVPGLYFVGIAAANSFGPLMRFAYGADFAARRVTQAVGNEVGAVVTPAPAVARQESQAKESKEFASEPVFSSKD